ncbi:MAG: hypothetical protein GTO40_08580 [Deltaproteobacteria bacterium]|nr:hypothetical protein [Deltaproteobacteria bacterium]
MKIAYRKTLLLSVLLLLVVCGGCAPALTDPAGPKSSLVIGRVVINNNYPGRQGLMPIGAVRQGITIEIMDKNRSLLITAVTLRDGYFMVPNIPQNAYYLSRIIFRGGAPNDQETMYLAGRRGVFFVPVPGEIVDLGTYYLNISDDAEVTPVYERANTNAAKAYLQQHHKRTPWLKRKFNP